MSTDPYLTGWAHTVFGKAAPDVTVVALVADLFGKPAVDLGATAAFSRIVPGMPDRYDGETGVLDDPALTVLASGTSAPAGVVLSVASLMT